MEIKEMGTTKERERTHSQDAMEPNTMGNHKAQLRKYFLEARKSMTIESVNAFSNVICSYILESDLYKKAQTILAYMPIRNEVDTVPIIRQCLEDGKNLYLPKVQGKEMIFYKIDSFDDLHAGAFGILEPKERNPIDRREGLMLVPGVAFSKGGFRIGYGGGYYDRYLEKDHGFTTVGLLYELQLSDDISPDIHDIQLHYIVTEKEIHRGLSF